MSMSAGRIASVPERGWRSSVPRMAIVARSGLVAAGSGGQVDFRWQCVEEWVSAGEVEGLTHTENFGSRAGAWNIQICHGIALATVGPEVEDGPAGLVRKYVAVLWPGEQDVTDAQRQGRAVSRDQSASALYDVAAGGVARGESHPPRGMTDAAPSIRLACPHGGEQIAQ
jgi:hypothetical protein